MTEQLAGVQRALDYEAPWLIEKLVKDRIVDTAADAELLFREVKRYIVMAHEDASCVWSMFSLHVDDCWHQFILFTTQYVGYCQESFGRYVHHAPSNAPASGAGTTRPVASFEQFRVRYEELFAETLPDVWYDDRTLTVRRRLVNDHVGRLAVKRDAGTVHLVSQDGETLLSVNDLAADALSFIARTGAFYVRELPGGLSDEEKVGLAAALVGDKVLRASG